MGRCSKLTQGVGRLIQVLPNSELRASPVVARGSLSSFPHGTLHRALYKVESDFIRVSERKRKQDGSTIALNLILEATSLLSHSVH